MGQRRVALRFVLVALASPAAAQVIPIRSIPLPQGDQFLLFPSDNSGMGGVSIALSDALLDPFRNPAAGARLGVRLARFFSSPALYSISRQTGGGRTLPLAALLRTGSWFGGVSLAVQEVDASGPLPSPPIILVDRPSTGAQAVVDAGPGERSHGNAYAFASLGTALPGGGLSLGGSVQWAGLHALDGADLLYPGSTRISQSGHALDVRLGLLKEWPGQGSLQALILHRRLTMTDDAAYVDLFWDPAAQQFVQQLRVEHSGGRTSTWGGHLEYQRPLGAAAGGWRIGWLATGNRLSVPGDPADELLHIPRDLGHASAFNFGIGLAKRSGAATFGIDAIYEPIWSTTTAVAATPVVTALGDTIPSGDPTLVSRFRFSDALLRMGVNQDVALSGLERAVGVQLGLAIRAVRYRLAQDQRVEVVRRDLKEHWVEWSPTWGVSLRFSQLELRYRGRAVNGMGRPATVLTGGVATRVDILPPVFLPVPTGPLSLTGVTTVTHQISLSLPLR